MVDEEKAVNVDGLTEVFKVLRDQENDLFSALTIFGEAFEAVFPDVDLTVKVGTQKAGEGEGSQGKAPWE